MTNKESIVPTADNFLAEKVWIYLKRSMAQGLENNKRNETKSVTMDNFA